jgi:hypothetical protein
MQSAKSPPSFASAPASSIGVVDPASTVVVSSELVAAEDVVEVDVDASSPDGPASFALAFRRSSTGLLGAADEQAIRKRTTAGAANLCMMQRASATTVPLSATRLFRAKW